MFRVYFTNFGWFSESTGTTLQEAIEIARKAGFEAIIVQDTEFIKGLQVATWSILSGTRMIRS